MFLIKPTKRVSHQKEWSAKRTCWLWIRHNDIQVSLRDATIFVGRQIESLESISSHVFPPDKALSYHVSRIMYSQNQAINHNETIKCWLDREWRKLRRVTRNQVINSKHKPLMPIILNPKQTHDPNKPQNGLFGSGGILHQHQRLVPAGIRA